MGISASTSNPRSPLSTVPRSSAVAFVVALCAVLAPLAGCGDDTGDGAGGGGTGSGGGDAACGTVESPTLLTLTNVSPANGSPVAAEAVVHAFTIVDAPGIIQQLQLQTGATHTAGTPDPAQLSFKVTQTGKDLTYTAEAVRWAATAHVELSVAGAFQIDDGCVFAFPSPLFNYDVQASEGSGGGTSGSGTGGSDGEGGGAGGDGGA